MRYIVGRIHCLAVSKQAGYVGFGWVLVTLVTMYIGWFAVCGWSVVGFWLLLTGIEQCETFVDDVLGLLQCRHQGTMKMIFTLARVHAR